MEKLGETMLEMKEIMKNKNGVPPSKRRREGTDQSETQSANKSDNRKSFKAGAADDEREEDDKFIRRFRRHAAVLMTDGFVAKKTIIKDFSAVGLRDVKTMIRRETDVGKVMVVIFRSSKSAERMLDMDVIVIGDEEFKIGRISQEAFENTGE